MGVSCFGSCPTYSYGDAVMRTEAAAVWVAQGEMIIAGIASTIRLCSPGC